MPEFSKWLETETLQQIIESDGPAEAYDLQRNGQLTNKRVGIKIEP